MTQPRNGESTMTTQPTPSAASTPYDRAKAAEANADTATRKPATKTAGKSSTKAKPAKPGKAKAPATKTTAKKGTKPTKGKAAKPAAPSTGKRKDEPIKGELKGATRTNYEKVFEAIPATKGEALNANQIAKRVNFWPIPCKRYLETAVDRGDAKKATDGSKVTYYKGADKKGKGGS
jgi:hypothetical protein